MELSWANKLRIAAVAALGILVIGIMAWPLAVPEDPLSPLRSPGIGLGAKLALLVVSFALGGAGYFLSWPNGREIGILTVPFGLAFWAVRSGPMQTLTQGLTETYGRQALVLSIALETPFWVLLLAAGFAGVLVAQYFRPARGSALRFTDLSHLFSAKALTTAAVGIVVATLAAQFFVDLLARDLVTSDNAPGAQPAVPQIVFAVIGAFAVAGFTLKLFFNLGYVHTALAALFVIPFVKMAYYSDVVAEEFTTTLPAVFFPHAALAILPIQMVAIGAIGAVIGYWLAVRYDFWRKHETA